MSQKKNKNFVNSPEYLKRKEYFSRFLTVYGRNIVMEALEVEGVTVERLHVAENVKSPELRQIVKVAEKSGVEINFTTAQKVSRISKNGRQDQGVAADISFPGYRKSHEFFAEKPATFRLLALDGVTTPRNVGMIIRSCASGGLDGVIIPEKGNCEINPLVIKASAGNIFRTGILRCGHIDDALSEALDCGAEICALAGGATQSLFDYQEPDKVVYVLGGEGEGVSEKTLNSATKKLFIPMSSGVESLNVAMAATLVSYQSFLSRK